MSTIFRLVAYRALHRLAGPARAYRLAFWDPARAEPLARVQEERPAGLPAVTSGARGDL